MIDTAGRLHNKLGLMQELEKISRVMKKLVPNAPNDVFLVLDATTGQNAIMQAREFSKVSDVSGLILTKLDGTAKGGVVIAIANELKLPVRYIGVGEGIRNDLQPFDTLRFVEALFERRSDSQRTEGISLRACWERSDREFTKTAQELLLGHHALGRWKRTIS